MKRQATLALVSAEINNIGQAASKLGARKLEACVQSSEVDEMISDLVALSDLLCRLQTREGYAVPKDLVVEACGAQVLAASQPLLDDMMKQYQEVLEKVPMPTRLQLQATKTCTR